MNGTQVNEASGMTILKSMPVQDAEVLLHWCREIIEGRGTLASLRGLSASDLEAVYRRAFDAWHAGDWQAATRDFAFLVIHQPNDPTYMFALGYVFHQQGEYKHALNFYTRAMFMQQSNPRVIYRMAQCMQALGEINGARDALDMVITLCHDRNENSRDDVLLACAKSLLLEINS
ncbi:CesD/SycD/LcrH family type III secretion system chaperone [Dyella sp. M7H15-1]|uniref:SycD/LcrH family type III secretion system chaperone n=1 Tax=Dyella sp. M7H15-1 TaxID=2501295 RepID=UPI0010051A52|nr:SycD/LcrH family type III secretion system chaperone [Dyella sp. M7H15-1]QAU24319.1 CesD/SycD/LcrH family type III secretion system chaperone [Dyella sp. M7H15-1]